MRDAGHLRRASHGSNASVDLDPGQSPHDAHDALAGVDLRAVQTGIDAHANHDGAPSCSDHPMLDAQSRRVAAPHDALLLILADALDDLERVRIATDNRIRSLAQVKGLDDSPETKRLAQLRDGIAALEHNATLDLQRAMRAHPLGPWVKRTVGVGEKQAARLLAAVGDPAERLNPAKLWQYCGHGDPARSKLRKGQPVEHSPKAKMRTRLIAESCMKQAHSPYRAVYDRERLRWADRDTTDLHRHNHALRVVGKAMLLDLWREARRLRGDQRCSDAHTCRVPAGLPPTIAPSTSTVDASAADVVVAA